MHATVGASDGTKQRTAFKRLWVRSFLSIETFGERKAIGGRHFDLSISVVSESTMASDLDKQIEMLRRCVRYLFIMIIGETSNV